MMFVRRWFKKSILLMVISVLCVVAFLAIWSKKSYAAGETCSASITVIFCHVSSNGSQKTTNSYHNGGSGINYKVVNSNPVCTWKYLGVGVNTFNSSFGSVQGTYYKISCSLNAIAPNLNDYNVVYYGPGYFVIWIPPSKPTTYTFANYKNIANQAANSIMLPSPYIVVSPSSMGIVNLPESFAINASLWHSYIATASVNGVSASAKANPVGIDWNFGDGSTMSCLSITKSSIPKTNICTHSYQMSTYLAKKFLNISSLGYLIKATVVWSVTWDSPSSGFSGNLGTLYTTGTKYLQVEQIESINQ